MTLGKRSYRIKDAKGRIIMTRDVPAARAATKRKKAGYGHRTNKILAFSRESTTAFRKAQKRHTDLEGRYMSNSETLLAAIVALNILFDEHIQGKSKRRP